MKTKTVQLKSDLADLQQSIWCDCYDLGCLRRAMRRTPAKPGRKFLVNEIIAAKNKIFDARMRRASLRVEIKKEEGSIL
jgi:hypothetical protein